MLVRNVPIWVLVFFLSSRTIVAQTPDLSEMIAESERSVVRIEVNGVDSKSQGSGFIVESNGLLVTNFHVLVGAEQAIVHFPSGSNYPIVGVKFLDPNRDIAIAKIDAVNLPVLKSASSLPRKGETVVGLGSPLGLSFTASNGIVSAIRTSQELRKELDDDEREGTWIQVNAALSPGSSGGPLVNSKGEYVAMSTLASSGVAQNINFGISVDDIRDAIKKASSRSLETLAATTAKMTMKDRKSGDRTSESIIKRKPIPASAFEAYVKATSEQTKGLMKQLVQEKKSIAEQLKEMKVGQEFIPPNFPPEVQIVRGHGKKSINWYFRNRNIKQQVITKAESRTSELAVALEAVTKGTPKDATLALATKFGPPLNPQKEGSIGFMSGAVVLHAFNKHDLIVTYQDVPYLMYMDSTAGLFPDEEIDPTAVFIAGTTVAPVQGSTVSITILQSVSDEDIRKEIFGKDSSAPRTWKSKDGKFSVEASFVSKNGAEVVLKKTADGKEIKVPLSKLSDVDLTFIGSK